MEMAGGCWQWQREQKRTGMFVTTKSSHNYELRHRRPPIHPFLLGIWQVPPQLVFLNPAAFNMEQILSLLYWVMLLVGKNALKSPFAIA